MKKYLELLYFGAYYLEWMGSRLAKKLLNPLLHWIIEGIPNLIPSIKKNLAKGGHSPRENADNVINYNNKLIEADVAHTFEYGAAAWLTVFFLFAYFDIMIILRSVFGSDWGFVKINRANGLAIMTFLAIISGVTSSVMIETIGKDEAVKKFRKSSKNKQRLAFWVFVGSNIVALFLFFILFIIRVR